MEINVILDKYKQDMKALYPKYSELTDNVFVIMQQMLDEDYDSISSDKKRLRIIKSYVYDIIQEAFEGNGNKNYLKNVVGVMFDNTIREYTCKKLDSEKESYLNIMDGLKYEIIYWQGCEGVEEKKLQRLLDYVR